jgi:Flp pilus assembly protein TadB
VPSEQPREAGDEPIEPDEHVEHGGGGLSRALFVYTAARLALLAGIAALLVLATVPLLVALLIAIVLSLSLSLVLFRRLRDRLTVELAAVRSRRRAERERLRASLRGDPDATEP